MVDDRRIRCVAEVDVTLSGLGYFRYWFLGLPGLCSQMLPLVEEQGRIIALVPEGTSEARALQFTSGGLGEFRPLSDWLIPHVMEALGGKSRGVILHQDIWAKPTDVLPSAPPSIVTEGPDAVYYLVTSDVLSIATFEACLNAPPSFMTAMLVIPDCTLSFREGRRILSAGELDKVAADVTEMIVPAYDQESYLVWRKAYAPVR